MYKFIHLVTFVQRKSAKKYYDTGDKNKKKKNSAPRKCTSCNDVGHDRRNCPNNNVPAI
jgi:hypothetical protein